MSRPPNQYARENDHTIDFRVGAPYCDTDHMVYAQAGFPGYVNANYPSQYVSAGYQPQQWHPQYSPIAAPAALPVYPSLESEVQERIRSNIDAIMETQKTAMLNSKLEKLTSRVQDLAQNIEGSRDGHEISHIKSLSDKVDRLSRNIELSQKNDKGDLSTTSEIAHRLRRLAADSKSEDRIPDW